MKSFTKTAFIAFIQKKFIAFIPNFVGILYQRIGLKCARVHYTCMFLSSRLLERLSSGKSKVTAVWYTSSEARLGKNPGQRFCLWYCYVAIVLRRLVDGMVATKVSRNAGDTWTDKRTCRFEDTSRFAEEHRPSIFIKVDGRVVFTRRDVTRRAHSFRFPGHARLRLCPPVRFASTRDYGFPSERLLITPRDVTFPPLYNFSL